MQKNIKGVSTKLDTFHLDSLQLTGISDVVVRDSLSLKNNTLKHEQKKMQIIIQEAITRLYKS